MYLYYQWNPNTYTEKRRKVILWWCFFMNETSEKIHNSSIGIKTKIEFGKIRLCYGLYISKFTKKFSTEKIGLFSKRQKKN